MDESALAALRTSLPILRGLLESAPDGIIVVDATGRIVMANTEAQKIFGYDEADLLGRPVEILVPEAMRTRHVEHRHRYCANPITRPMGVGLTLAGRRRDGHEVPVEISLSPMSTPDGVLVTAVVRDMTERRQAEQEIRRLNDTLARRVDELDAVNRELEAFSYSVSHDLRAPLRSIDGFSRALLEDYADQLDATAGDYLRRIRRATQRMGELIDELLDLSRVTRREMHREQVDLSALARAVLGELARSEPDRRVDIAITDGLVAHGDAHLLRLMLENLLGNAWKFTSQQRAARIEFGARPEGGRVVYYVQDNGVGFDMAYADKLFGAFQRLHAAADFPGTGIGLATVQRIVLRHGGRIGAQGQLGQGATFSFTLG